MTDVANNFRISLTLVVLCLCSCARDWRPASPTIVAQSRQVSFSIPHGWMQRPLEVPVVIMKDNMSQAWMHVQESAFSDLAGWSTQNKLPLWKQLADWEVDRQQKIFSNSNFKVIESRENPIEGYPGACVEIQFTEGTKSLHRRRICEFVADNTFYRFALTSTEERYFRDIRADFDAILGSIKRIT